MKKWIKYSIILFLIIAIAVIILGPRIQGEVAEEPEVTNGKLLTEDPYGTYRAARAAERPIFLEFYARW